jgi:histidinol-phosphate aminotransferase
MTPAEKHPVEVDKLSTQACVAASVRTDVQQTSAYVVAPADGYVKLDAMENPFALPATVQQALGKALSGVALNRYPAVACEPLEQALRQSTPIPAAAQIMFGNGSDELIHLIIQTCCAPGDVVLSPVPTFVMYAVSAQWNHARFEGVPTTAGFDLDMPALLAAIALHRPKVLFVAYPNNPTGKACSSQELLKLADAMAPGLLVVDEAYAPFSSDSFMAQVLDLPNVVVVRTVSKQGLAGIRLGYMAGSAHWMREFDKVRPPYNIDVLTRAAATCVLQHHSVLDEQAAELVSQRIRLAAALNNTPGVLQVYESQANFLLFKVKSADDTFLGLKNAGILIKNVSKSHPLLAGCLRVTVSTAEENQLFLQALNKVMAS